MAEFPKMDEFIKEVVEKVLDEILFNGKSIRELAQIIASEDCISRKAVLDKEVYTETSDGWTGWTVDVNDIKALPPVLPQQEVGWWITKKIR